MFLDLCVFSLSTFPLLVLFFFFFNDTATTEIYTLSLHDALPIYPWESSCLLLPEMFIWIQRDLIDRKSTRLNSSHQIISYAVFCLKKKNKTEKSEREKRHMEIKKGVGRLREG